MRLQVSIVLLFILLTGGFSLDCYNCKDQQGGPCEERIICENEQSMCASRRILKIESTGHCTELSKTFEKSCAMPDECESWSFRKHIWSKSVSVQCCDTDLCNEQDGPDNRYYENGKRCFTCDKENCSHKVSCKRNEDYCFTAFEYQKQTVKGCASAYVCYNAPKGLELGEDISCCSGDLCNSAEGVTQSFLVLHCSLLSFILLH